MKEVWSKPGWEDEPTQEMELPWAVQDVLLGDSIDRERSAKLSVGEAQRPLHDQDVLLVDRDRQLFAIFDGMGGAKGGRQAAEYAKQAFLEAEGYGDDPEKVLDIMEYTLWTAHEKIITEGGRINEIGGTTAVVAKAIFSEAGNFLVWVSVGDSRLYMIEDRNSAIDIPVQLSEDEGYENVLNNCLGWAKDGYRGLQQAGVAALRPGMRFLICSDGVTGDRGYEIIDAPELGAMVFGQDASAAAESAVNCARKRDDRSMIVIDIE